MEKQKKILLGIYINPTQKKLIHFVAENLNNISPSSWIRQTMVKIAEEQYFQYKKNKQINSVEVSQG